jgi:hypothetical protein
MALFTGPRSDCRPATEGGVASLGWSQVQGAQPENGYWPAIPYMMMPRRRCRPPGRAPGLLGDRPGPDHRPRPVSAWLRETVKSPSWEEDVLTRLKPGLAWPWGPQMLATEVLMDEACCA